MSEFMSDDDQAAAAEAQRLVHQRRRSNLVNWVMDGKLGREFVHGILDQAGPFRSAFDPTSDRLTAFQLGRQDIGLRVLAELTDICPEKVQLMMREAYERNSRGPSSTE